MPRALLPVLLTGVLLLAGCATRPPVPVSVPAAGAAPPPRFDGTVLYQILAGEFSLRAGDRAAAAEHYLRAAFASRDPGVVRRAVRVALLADRPDEALRAARLWLRLEPRSVAARQVLLAAELRRGRIDEALEAAEAVLAAAPSPEEGWRMVLGVLAGERDQEVAETVAARLAERHGHVPDAQLAAALLAERRGDAAAARAAAERALALRPGWPRAWRLLARVLEQEGRGAEAAERLAEALARIDDPELRLVRARLLVRLGRNDEARAEFGRLLAVRPDDPEVRYALALLALRAGEREDARRHLERLVAMGARADEAAYFLGQIAEEEGDLEGAAEWYGRVGGGRYRMEAALRAAVLRARGGAVEEALERLRRLGEQHPDQEVRIVLAETEILREAGRLEEAFARLSDALERHPDDADLRYARALVAEGLDRLDVTEADLRRILAADPDNAAALNALGYTLADRTDRYEEALALIRRALALRPDDAAIVDSMGWVLYRLGRLEEATRYLRRALELGWDPEIAAHLGEVLWQRGMRKEARRVWAEALAREPGAEAVRRTMERLLP